jgi:hypothetical protein
MKEMLRNPPSLIRIGNGSAKYEPRPLSGSARRPATRRVLPLLLVAFVLSYLAYTRLSQGDDTRAGDTRASILSSIPNPQGLALEKKQPQQQALAAPVSETASVELEPKPHRLELVSPMYNIKVLRSVMQHSNTSWQDKPGEAHGYFVQSLVWFQNVSDGTGRSRCFSRARTID